MKVDVAFYGLLERDLENHQAQLSRSQLVMSSVSDLLRRRPS